MGNENHTAGGEGPRPEIVQTLLVLDTGFSQGQSNLNRPQIAVQKWQGKKKNLQERNQGKWVCSRDGFVAVVALFKSDPLEGNIKTRL